MLTRRLIPGAIAGSIVGVLALPLPAAADVQGQCPITSPNCEVTGTQPGGPGAGAETGTGGGAGTGSGDGGGASDPNACRYELADPQPPPGTDGHPAGTGAYYMAICPTGDGGVSSRLVWLETPPADLGPSPEELARRALAQIRLDGAQIGIAPSPDGAGLVGLPVWLWTAVTPNTWGPISASDTDGLTVTITAQATHIVWDMGDGNSVTCTSPGTPYDSSYGSQPSPTCGYPRAGDSTPGYQAPSRTQPDGVYHITATTHWRVDWSGGGQSGVLVATRTAHTTVRIDELQVVIS